MNKKLLKNKYFIILVIIVVALIIIKILSPNSPDNDFSPTTISTNQNPNSSLNNPPNSGSNLNTVPSLTPAIEITEVNYQIPLTNLLPYKGKYFEVKRYLKANNLELIVFGKANTDLAKKEAQEWLVKNGVETLDTFTVVYQ